MRAAGQVFSPESQYLPFVAVATGIAVVVGLPLGLLLALAAAQGSTLGGRWAPLAQLHGHLQLAGWGGLFVMGVGFRLIPRFTGSPLRPAWAVPLVLLLVGGGLALRGVQPFAEGGVPSAAFAASAVLEAAGALLFGAAVLGCLLAGRRDEFLYRPFFAAGIFWLAVTSLLNAARMLEAAAEGDPTISAAASLPLSILYLYGFIAMFILAVSLRALPVFFNRPRARPWPTLIAWAAANGGIAAYGAGALWHSYDPSAPTSGLQGAGLLAAALSLLALALDRRVVLGVPSRLRPSARRSALFVRAAYGWLAIAALLQALFAGRALLDRRPPALYELDTLRHLVALGFMTSMIIGMALLVLPRLAMRRLRGTAPLLFISALFVLLHAATLGRGLGSLLVNEGEVTRGFWTMSAAGILAFLALALFAAYLTPPPPEPEIPLQPQPERDA